jgi:hypothetical protein
MDVDSIPFGVDFRIHLEGQVAKCEVFLALIGRDWMKKRGSKEPRPSGRGSLLFDPVLLSGAIVPVTMNVLDVRPDDIQSVCLFYI